MNTPHPVGISGSQVIVDCDDVDTVAGERIEIHRKRRDESLAFTRLHFGDPSEMQRRAAHHLYVVVALANFAASCLADNSKCLDKEVFEISTIGQLLSELNGPVSECSIGQSFDFGFEGIDLRYEAFDSPYLLAFAGAQNFVEDAHENGESTDAFLRSRSEEGEKRVRTPPATQTHVCDRSGVAANASPKTESAPASHKTVAAAASVDPVVTTSSRTTTISGIGPVATKWTP